MNKAILFTAIGALLIIGGTVLTIFYDLRLLGFTLDIVGCSVIVLYFGLTTKKYIRKKDAIGKRLRICYVVGFLIVVAGVILVLIQGNFLVHGISLGRSCIFLGLFGVGLYLIHIHDKIIKERAKSEINIK